MGFGGATPLISERRLERGDRVLFFTDGITEEHLTGGELFGEARLIGDDATFSAAGGLRGTTFSFLTQENQGRIWVSVDAFTYDAARIGVPAAAS